MGGIGQARPANYYARRVAYDFQSFSYSIFFDKPVLVSDKTSPRIRQTTRLVPDRPLPQPNQDVRAYPEPRRAHLPRAPELQR